MSIEVINTEPDKIKRIAILVTDSNFCEESLLQAAADLKKAGLMVIFSVEQIAEALRSIAYQKQSLGLKDLREKLDDLAISISMDRCMEIEPLNITPEKSLIHMLYIIREISQVIKSLDCPENNRGPPYLTIVRRLSPTKLDAPSQPKGWLCLLNSRKRLLQNSKKGFIFRV